MRRLTACSVAAASVAGVIVPALAARFSDVPSSHRFAAAIERLAAAGVVTGNPDGTFAPEKTVNRAEFLTMLYRARGITPSATAVCLRDVIAGSWYLPVVCDAVKRGYVGGYSDGTFRAGNPVNRAEAVKMLLTAMELPVGDFTERDRAAIAYPDVSLSAWYTKYLAAAFRLGVLPLEGQSPAAFGPEQALSRGEAAAYIDSALRADGAEESSSSSSVSESSASSAMTRSSAPKSSASSIAVRETSFPLADQGTLPAKGPAIYRFTITSSFAGEIVLTAPGAQQTAQCTLYKLDEEGLPLEVYPGGVSEGRCFLRVALHAGSYQLELRGASQPFTLTSRAVTGDGNDGNAQAKTLQRNSTRVGMLEVDDHADYFTFGVATQESLLVEMSNSEQTRCTVVPLDDVDLYGFSSPECATAYAYPPGTYVVVIDRKPGTAWAQVNYGVVLKSAPK